MKYLDRFENHYLMLTEVILTLEDILLELADEGITWKITPSGDIRKKILSMYLRDIVKTPAEFSITFDVNSNLSKSAFLNLPEFFIDVLARIEDYIKSIGLNVMYSVKTEEWLNIDNLDDLSECTFQISHYLVSKIKLEFVKQ
jgi:hypothetical protein